MKKKILTLVLSLFCLCGAAACSNGGSATPQSLPEQRQAEENCPNGDCPDPQEQDCPHGNCPDPRENDCPDGDCPDPQEKNCPDGDCPDQNGQKSTGDGEPAPLPELPRRPVPPRLRPEPPFPPRLPVRPVPRIPKPNL